jgi:hypothetical protein
VNSYTRYCKKVHQRLVNLAPLGFEDALNAGQARRCHQRVIRRTISAGTIYARWLVRAEER